MTRTRRGWATAWRTFVVVFDNNDRVGFQVRLSREPLVVDPEAISSRSGNWNSGFVLEAVGYHETCVGVRERRYPQ
jgi:hypothetical protein